VGAPPIGLLPARLVSAGDQAGFVVGGRTLPLWSSVPLPLLDHVGREVVLGLRAEDVRAVGSGPDPDPDSVELGAVVTEAEYTGRQSVVTVTVDVPAVTAPGSELAAGSSGGATLHAFLPSRASIRAGDRVRVAVQGAGAHVFDADTGRALWHPGMSIGGREDREIKPAGP
jgi:multiple sugar transport system ATP-binding protein